MPLFFHKPSNKISDLRSAETSPVKSSTEFQHLIIFSAVITCRCFAHQLGCCCFMFTHMKFISEGLYQGHRASPQLWGIVTPVYCVIFIFISQTISISSFLMTRIHLKLFSKPVNTEIKSFGTKC